MEKIVWRQRIILEAMTLVDQIIISLAVMQIDVFDRILLPDHEYENTRLLITPLSLE
jgi:hypothetical protein